uniref:Ig-like domain-containing protein n=1 Tax=Strigamia maritima TaxID=126957 RepID=T1JKF8_STRMM
MYLGGRFTVFPNGILHIRDVNAGDGGRHYRCRTQHRLTGEIRLSNTAGRLLITEPQSSVPPRITHSMGMVEAYQGDAVELPCAAQGSPTPAY